MGQEFPISLEGLEWISGQTGLQRDLVHKAPTGGQLRPTLEQCPLLRGLTAQADTLLPPPCFQAVLFPRRMLEQRVSVQEQ